MPEQVTQIHLASSILRAPELFDGLGPPDKPGVGETRIGRRKYGAATGGILRDLILFAALRNQRVCELRLPEFCAMMGYDSQNLTRRCTEEEVAEIKRTGWPEDYIDAFSNVLGLALVRLVRNNFVLASKAKTIPESVVQIGGAKIVEYVNVFEAKSTGTLLSFTLSNAILSKNRREFQTPILEEYLSLRTQGKTAQEGYRGKPDHAARRMYLRLTWLRQYHDYFMREGQYEDARNLLDNKNEYQALLKVAGLSEHTYWPAKRVAAELRKLLERVGSMASIRLVAEVKARRGEYEVVWREQALAVAEAEPEVNQYPCAPAPAKWGTAPAPGAPRPARRAATTTKPANSPQIKPAPAKPKPVQRANQPNREKLKGQLEDQAKRIKWLQEEAPKLKSYQDDPQLLEKHLEQARADLHAIQNQLTGA